MDDNVMVLSDASWKASL